MSRKLKLLILMAAIHFTAMSVLAKSKVESTLLLKDALADSNADYNKHKKVSLDEENQRVNQWNDQTQQVVFDEGHQLWNQADQEEYKRLKKDLNYRGREVSSQNDSL